MTGIIDYGAGNLKSVCNSLNSIGAKTKIVRSSKDLENIKTLIFPGVGAFGDSVIQLHKQNLYNPLRDWIAKDRPFLGICIGFQMLFEGSDESPGTKGLGILRGRVVQFPQQSELKVPHMGWNRLKLKQESDPIWEGLGKCPYFYFVHSYFPKPEEKTIVASTTPYGLDFVSSIRRGRLFATQFHPEKSQEAGLRLIRNFLSTNSKMTN